MPEPWNTFLSIAPPAPKVAITYYELGLDLGGRADASRRALFRAMLMYLAWPKGTALFLPCTALDGNSLVPGTDAFWHIARSYGIRQVACFGEPAQRVIAPGCRMSQYRIQLDTVTINVFPAPFDLANLKSHERRLAISPLRELRFS